MALTKASALHYWSARYGTIPIVGGRPTHTRNSAGAVVDASGIGYNAIINTPRFSWETDKATTANEKRAALLLEPLAQTNLNTSSENFAGAGWGNSSVTITTGQADPFGGANASLLNGTAAGAFVNFPSTGYTSGTRARAVYLKQGTGANPTVIWYDGTAAVQRGAVVFQWSASGALQLNGVSGGGALLAIESLAGGWYRALVACSGIVGGNQTYTYIYPASAGAGTGTTYAFGDLAVNSEAVGSYIKTAGSTASRASDLFTFACQFPFQQLVMYARWVEGGGSKLSTSNRIAQVGSNPEMCLYYNGSGIMFAEMYNGTAVSQSTQALVPNVGDTVEALLCFGSDTSARLMTQVNGGGITSNGAGSSQGLVLTSAPTSISMASIPDGTQPSLQRMLDLRIVKFADCVSGLTSALLTELASFELGPNGDLL